MIKWSLLFQYTAVILDIKLIFKLHSVSNVLGADDKDVDEHLGLSTVWNTGHRISASIALILALPQTQYQSSET